MKGMGALHVGAAAIGGTAAIALMSAMPAHAQSQWWQPGWYADVHAGAVYLQDPHPNVVGSFDPVVKLHTNIGAAAGISAGYQGLFLPGIRVEGEFTYRTNGVDRASSSGFIGSRSATGTIDSAAFMSNLLYDFMTDSRWTPYIGVGAGGARITLNDINIQGFTQQLSGDEWRFAYQGIAVCLHPGVVGQSRLPLFRDHGSPFQIF